MTSSLLLALACSPTAAAKLLRGSVAAANGTVPQLPAANYAGIGYDILQGNPLADGLDKGYRAAVLDAASFAQGLKTPDGKWAIPDNTEAVMASACDIQSGGSQRLVTGETSLGTTSQNDVSVGGEAWKVVAFKASAGFKKTTSDVTASSDDTVVFYSRGTIELYKLNVETALATLSPNFAAAVGALPTDADGRIKSTFAAGAGFEYCLGVDAATVYDDQGTGLIYLACDQADPKAIQWQLVDGRLINGLRERQYVRVRAQLRGRGVRRQVRQRDVLRLRRRRLRLRPGGYRVRFAVRAGFRRRRLQEARPGLPRGDRVARRRGRPLPHARR